MPVHRNSPTKRRARGRIVAGALGVVLACTIPYSVTAEHEGDAAKRAAREIQAARDRANDAAQEMFDAENEFELLSIEIADTEVEVAAIEVELADMRSSLSESAVRQFTGGGINSNPLLSPIQATTDQYTASVLAGAATGSVLVDTDEFEATLSRLDDVQQSLESKRARSTAAFDRFEQLKAVAEAEVAQLQEIENQRLQDAAVQHELDALRAQRLAAEQAEADKQAAAAAAQSQSTSSAQPQQAAATEASSSQSSDSSNSSNSSNSSESSNSSNNSSPSPAPAPPPPPRPGIACPVAGATAFSNTWGAPRSGGRRHQGVDMISPKGTPLAATESGRVNFKTTRLGGLSVWMYGSSGTSYFYAHLSSFNGSSRSVSKGEIIGYVGSTGNTSVNHLHFEIHPGGGVAVPPYSTVRAVC